MNRAFAYPLCAAFAFTAAPAFADWGAVAVNKNSGRFGYTNKWNSKREASQRALSNCKRFSEGVPGCELVLTTRKCFAASYVGRNVYVEEARSKSAAAKAAKAACRSKHGAACSEIGKHVHCASE